MNRLFNRPDADASYKYRDENRRASSPFFSIINKFLTVDPILSADYLSGRRVEGFLPARNSALYSNHNKSKVPNLVFNNVSPRRRIVLRTNLGRT